MIPKFVSLFICLFVFNISIAQKAQTELLPNTVENQFKKVYKNANNYQIYKVVKKEVYLNLQKNVLDSISIIKGNLISKKQEIKNQQQKIKGLNSKITELNKSLSISLSKEDTISLFGIQLKKTSYNTILWGVITILFISLLFFIYKFKESSTLTKEAKNNLAEIEQEFEEHRKKSLEKEQKIRRQLQDEINKQRGA
ncbi:hypothetical protein [Tenacibaculum maritimum]|uniref:hypothetical protein n=1 Tax=Tenacibaculum maritimum TaxID=107401 RepID=UPI0012E643A5|nr:hypothetical protein [Tenacibaculum maritimum]MDB0602491.1 hypothetical protein [Tenacibaculum maritimum]MDB0613903.1 hypothetical protein [Tenacibaculum maritimum]CAA0207497.1 conserved exported hypothetical protein [Tenacibaculum maritimum]